MKTLVQRWGNSLAIRIPKSFADNIAVREGDTVQIIVTEGRLVLIPPPTPEYQLADLLAGICRGNLHEEITVDGSRGREAW